MRWSNSDPVTGQAAWFDLRVKVERIDPRNAVVPSFGMLPDPASVPQKERGGA